ncbi:MAG: glycosyltransferase family 39 protein [Phycisphaeraceae bacterium]|nr:glycosyltransferase family 39 protein [Phycisphaeraceae bacterium]
MESEPHRHEATLRVLLCFVLVASAAIAIVHACMGRALETHEIFVAQSTREMFEFHEPIVPTFGETPRLKKPPLMYWAVGGVAILSQRPDVPEWVARLPSALAAVWLVCIAWLMGSLIYGRVVGLLAAAATGLSLGVFEYAAIARPEMLYAATTATSAYAFLRAWNLTALSDSDQASSLDLSRLRRHRTQWSLVAWAFIGLAVLTKGPQIPILVVLGFSVYAVRHSGWKAWRDTFKPFLGMALALVLVAPWFFAVMLRLPGAQQIWIDELIGQRFGEKDGSNAGFLEWLLAVATPDYLIHAITFLLPWGLLAPIALAVPWLRHRPGNERGRMLFMGLIVVLIGLSLVRHSRDYYILPVVPMLAVLIARAACGLFDQARASSPVRWFGLALVSLITLSGMGLSCYAIAQGHAEAKDMLALCVSLSAVAVVAFAIMPRSSDTRRIAPIAAPIASWVCGLSCLAVNANERDARRERLDQVARAAAHLAGTDTHVIAIEFDPSNLMYRLDDPPIVFQSGAAPEEIVQALPVVLVAPPEWADRVDAIDGVHVVRSDPIDIKSGRWIEVVRVTRDE